MPSTISSLTSSPASIAALAFSPKELWAVTAARNRSPVEICGTLKRSTNSLAWVPLPDPGAPNSTMRMNVLSSRHRAAASLLPENQRAIKYLPGAGRVNSSGYRDAAGGI